MNHPLPLTFRRGRGVGENAVTPNERDLIQRHLATAGATSCRPGFAFGTWSAALIEEPPIWTQRRGGESYGA